MEAFHLQRTRFELIVERKLRRRLLTDDGNVEITGRDLPEKRRTRTAQSFVGAARLRSPTPRATEKLSPSTPSPEVRGSGHSRICRVPSAMFEVSRLVDGHEIDDAGP
jgi:hypothetical protein